MMALMEVDMTRSSLTDHRIEDNRLAIGLLANAACGA